MLQGLLVVAFAGSLLHPAPIVKQKEEVHTLVGQIIIIGNRVTPDDVIRGRLPLYSGQVLSQAALRTAEQKLSCLHLLGIASAITVLDLDGDNPVKDIQVTVQETAFTYLTFGPPWGLDSLLWIRKNDP